MPLFASPQNPQHKPRTFQTERNAFVAFVLLFALACGDDDLSVDSGGPDALTDAATDMRENAPDAADLGIEDSGQTDSGPDGSIRDASPDGGDAAEPLRLRIVAANLTSAAQQTYDPGHGVRILQGIDGDIVLLQELNFGNDSPSAMRTFAQRVCGEECEIVRGTGNLIPNGILSRHPILDSGVWEDPQGNDTREFVWARIDIPGDVDLWAVSVHLLTRSSTVRGVQAEDLLVHIMRDVPETDHLVIGGDFNSATGRPFTVLSARVDVSVRAADQSGDTTTNAPRSRALDGIYVSDALDALEGVVTLGTRRRRALVVDTRVFTPLVDIEPAEGDDSDAEGMQHMAVVRDFLL